MSPSATGRVLGAIALLVLLPITGVGSCAVRMPGPHFAGRVPRIDPGTARRLAHDLDVLAEQIGERHIQGKPEALQRAVGHVRRSFTEAGYAPELQTVPTPSGPTANVIARRSGTTPERFVIGAHLDTAAGTPGADDNASGVAALLELARRLSDDELPLTVEFVAWTNEEPPWFWGPSMGSAVHAAELAKAEVPVRMVWSLEMLGFFDDTPGSQAYPWPMSAFYPSEANFIGFVGNTGSGAAVRSSVRAFREAQVLPAHGASLPRSITGVDWSDHRSYWPYGIDAVMVTDTSLFRNPHYHEASDRADTLDVERLARVVHGLESALRRLATP